MTQWRGLLIFFLLFFPLPFPPSVTWLGCISDPIQWLHLSVLCYCLLEKDWTHCRILLLSTLSSWWTFPLPFSVPFQTLAPTVVIRCSFLSSVFTEEHHSCCRYFPYSITQRQVLLLANTSTFFCVFTVRRCKRGYSHCGEAGAFALPFHTLSQNIAAYNSW